LPAAHFPSSKIWQAPHVFHKISSFSSFWDAFELNVFFLSTNSLVVKMIPEKRLREALLLTSFESLGVTVTVGSKQLK